MGNRIVISESQYSRLFLNEQQPILLGVNKEFDSYGKYNIVEQFAWVNDLAGWLDHTVGGAIEDLGDAVSDQIVDAYNVIARDLSSGSFTKQTQQGIIAVVKELNPTKAVPEIVKGVEEVTAPLLLAKSYEDIGDGIVTVKDYVETEVVEPLWEVGVMIYNIFDCGEQNGIEYFHCVMGNASIVVSLVPVLGTLASAIIDAVDAVVYIGEANIDAYKGAYYLLSGNYEKSKEYGKEASIKLGFAGLSALGIIPGVTEARAVFKSGPKVLKASDNIIKELAEKGVQKMEPKEFEEIINRNAKNLNQKERKKVGEVMEELKNSKVADELLDVEKAVSEFNKFSDEFMKANKLTKLQYAAFINGSSFKKLMAKHGNDFYKAVNDNTIREVIKTFLIQLGISTAIVGGVKGYEMTKEERLKKDASKGNIASMVKLEGYDWPTTRDKIFMSDKTGEENGKLKQAWIKGWRPWPKGEKPTAENVSETSTQWLIENPKYQTKKFKEQFKGVGGENTERLIAPEDPNERKEGVLYYRNQKHKDSFENADDDITDEEFDESDEILRSFLTPK
jgi:hypothetical protein